MKYLEPDKLLEENMSVVEARNISKEEKGKKIIGNFSLNIDGGEIVGIKCSKSVGKSIVDILTGLVMPSSGEVLLGGAPIYGKHKENAKSVGIYTGDDGIYEKLTPKGYISFFSKLYDFKTDVDQILKDIGLADSKDLRIRNLNSSQQKRLSMARAILHDPKFVILEGPFNNVDFESIVVMRDLILKAEAYGAAVVIIMSSLEELFSIAKNVYILDDTGLDRAPDDTRERVQRGRVDSLFKIKRIPAKVDDKIILFNPMDIMYIESTDRVSMLHTEGGKYPCTITLSELEEKLTVFGFFRSHRSYLVNLQRLKEVVSWSRNSYTLVLDDEKSTEVPLSKGRLDELNDILGL
jgi:ABC-2 type transport system ATP-binding protein